MMSKETLREVMAEMGRRGSGDAKRRSAEDCRRAQKKSVEARRANKARMILANKDGPAVTVENSLK